MSTVKLPTVTGFYWVRVRPEFRGVETLDEQVVYYDDELDSLGSKGVCAHGNECGFAVEDFEWLEGPIKRQA